MLSLVVVALAVLIGSAAITARLRLRGFYDVALGFSTVALAQMLVAMLIAGVVLRRFDAGHIAAVNVVLATGALAFGARSLARERPRGRVRPASVEALVRSASAHPWVSLICLLAVAAVAWRVVLAYALPSYGYDALWYHLTSAAWWIQNGVVEVPPFGGDTQQFTYPAAGALLFASVPLFLESDTWIDAGQLPFAGLGAVAVAGLARTLGAGREWALAAAGMFLLTPIVLTQSTANYVDLALAATELLTLYFLLRALGVRAAPQTAASSVDHSPRGALIFLAGVAGGLAVGIKATALIFVAIFGAVLAAHLVAGVRARRIVASRAAALLLAFLVPVVAVGGYWYARNWVELGNPLYPAKVEVLGTTVFGGPGIDRPDYTESVLRLTARSWGHDALLPLRVGREGNFYNEEQRVGGLGPLWVYVGLPALIVAAGWAARRAPRIFWTVLVPVALVFFIQPYQWWSRFTIFVGATGAVAAALIGDRLREPRVLAALKLGILVLLIVQVIMSTASLDRWGQRLTPDDVISLAGERAEERSIGDVFLPDYQWVEDVPPTSRIGAFMPNPTPANVEKSRPFFYPLYGRTLSHDVFWVDPATPRALERRTAELRLDYLYVARISRLDEWAERSRRFGPLQVGEFGAAYEVLP